MSSSTRTASWRTANMGSQSNHSTMNQSSNTAPSGNATPPLSLSFYNNSNNPLTSSSNNKSSSSNDAKTPKAGKKGYGTYATPKKSTSTNALRPVAVRERSKAIPGCRELRNHLNSDPFSKTVIFLIMTPSPLSGDNHHGKENATPTLLPTRVNVFCDTGTIGTARVVDGQVRQTFRRNVTSLDVVERLLRHPEGPVEIQPSLIGTTDGPEEQRSRVVDVNNIKREDAQKAGEFADVGLCILEGEREKLVKHLRHLDEEAEKQARGGNKQKQQGQQLKSQNVSQNQKPQKSAGDLQAQMLEKAMAAKKGDDKSQGGNSTNTNTNNTGRIGRRRNKFTKLRSRNFNNKQKDDQNGSVSSMNNTKRRGGKMGASSSSNVGNGGNGGSSKMSKATTITANTGGQTTRSSTNHSNHSKSNNNNSYEDRNDSHSRNSQRMLPKKKNSSNKPNSFKNCGYEFHFKLPAEVMNQVDQCLRDIAKMSKVVKGVATNGRGTVFLYGNGGVAYTPAIPKALYQKLRQLRSSSYSSRPCFVSLGTRDRYFVSFNDGTADWKASNALDKMLKKMIRKNQREFMSSGGSQSASSNTTGGRSKRGGMSFVSSASTQFTNGTHATDSPAALLPRSVAFGATYDTFFVVFHDGSWQYQGRSIPKSLEDKLKDRDDADDLVVCNLGPNGEWFMKAENGKMWWSGITPELDAVLKKITARGYLHNMDFGENGSYFVSYDEE
mmetsp:Transcript_6832/g.19780  ORF Transcript_6832/g.19780 Transcript_6832/m.19780 type:complete len:723 (-) Transcript_6832:930-3098(-)